jgi:putative flippase GtrA
VYLLVGGFVYALDLCSFSAVVLIWPEKHIVGNVIGKLIGAVAGFLLHKYFSFAGPHRYSGVHQLGAYLLVLISNIGLGTVLIYFFVDIFGSPKIPARILVDVVIVVITFRIYRKRVFGHATSAAGQPPSRA